MTYKRKEIICFIILTFRFSWLSTQFYRRSGGSVLIAILFHFAGNLFYNIIPSAPAALDGNIIPSTIASILIFVSGIVVLRRKTI